MKSNRQNRLIACMLVLGSSTANIQANPDNQNSDYVYNVSLAPKGGNSSTLVVIKNTSANKSINAINIVPQSSDIDIALDSHVKCIKDQGVNYKYARAYFGPISLVGDSIVSSQALYGKAYTADFAQWEGVADGGWLSEAGGNAEPFAVPLASIKQGHPAVRFDPVEELNKKLQTHLNQGGSKLSFYQQDKTIEVQRPISLAGWCHSQTADKAGYETTMVNLIVKYEGDPQLVSAQIMQAQKTVALNPQLEGNLPNQVNQDFPFVVNNATFQPNMPHHVGKCVPNENPKIRINYTVSGNENGLIDWVIAPVSNTYAADGFYFQTSGMAKDPQNAAGHIDFEFPLKEMLSQNKYSYMKKVNKTFNHNMQIRARYKPFNGGVWSEFKDFGTAVFKHRCTPALNMGVPQGGIGGYQNGGPTPPAKAKFIKATPSEPTPLGKAAPQPAPTPKPLGIAVPTPSPEPGLILKSAKPTR